MRIFLLLVLSIQVLPSSAQSDAQDPLAPKTDRVKKVLLIGWDGVRVDVLASTDTPNFDRLAANGTFSDSALTRMPTVSGPGWSSMVTGVWAEKHGVMGNEFSANDYERYPDFLTRLEQLDPSFATFAVLNWPPLGTTNAGGPMIGDGIDVKININGDTVGYQEADDLACRIGEDELRQGDSDALFLYFGNIDVVGHATSSLSPEYAESIREADRCLGRLMAAVRGRITFESEDWLVLMSTDHGRTDEGGHGGESLKERTIFYLASGVSALKSTPVAKPNIVDVAVTALTHLGIAVEEDWDLDGEAVGLRDR